MKKIKTILSLIIISSICVFAEPPPDFDTDSLFIYIREKYPKSDNLEEIRKFTEISKGEKNIYQFWQYLFHKRRYSAIYLQVQVFHTFFPEMNYDFGNSDSFVNPIDLAFKEKNIELVRKLIDNFPDLASLSSKNEYGFPLRPPISYAIEDNNIDLVKIFIDLKVPLDYEKKITETNRNPYNLLSYSRTIEMDNILKASGVIEQKKLQNTIHATIIDSNVRLRSDPNLESKVIKLLSKDEKIEILGYGFKYYNLNSTFSFPHKWFNWFLIRAGNEIGWSYGEYVGIPQR